MSLAEVTQSGPFSDFAGYERTLMLVEGYGIELDIEGGRRARLDRPHEPFVFDGGARTHCTLLGGAVKDLNLMVAREHARGSVRILGDQDRGRLALDAGTTLAYALRGAFRMHLDGVEIELQTDELLQVDEARGHDLEIEPLASPSRLALLRIEPR
jgi:environmental stress-induced protein Ves